MNDSLRRTWTVGLVAVVALLYLWIGLVGHGPTRLLGIGGAVLIVAALAAAPRSVPIALALLAIGALSLAVLTWWSIITPILAVLALLLGWIAVRRLHRSPDEPAHTPKLEPIA